jgi:penicillin-binding protein-related factor A (putative recombinase)
MSESVCDKIIIDSVTKTGGWGYKITDFAQSKSHGRAPKNPFDLILFYSGNGYAVEDKYLPTYEAFNFNRMIKPHQIENLFDIYQTAPNNAFFSLWIQETSQKYYVLNFSPAFILDMVRNGKHSITKLELLKLREACKGQTVIRRELNVPVFLTKIIQPQKPLLSPPKEEKIGVCEEID